MRQSLPQPDPWHVQPLRAHECRTHASGFRRSQNRHRYSAAPRREPAAGRASWRHNPCKRPSAKLPCGSTAMLDYVVFFSSCFFDTEPFRTLEEGGSRETLQFWECEERMVVVGASGQWNRDLHEEACTADKVPVVQRLSGGGAVIVGR